MKPDRVPDERAARRAALLAARQAAWLRRRARGFQPRRLPFSPASILGRSARKPPPE
ncbi:hypothetical protein [Kineococcus rhizosphaerae]|uniref:Uncharacterized protein n=1 Tax=Kineococcus rhizosphaerae TaxID=559628 RepID=A0A2T0RAP0_9ACTN|nr:hypothetical protein [Kineococcus rhizosphaerae]PRY18238.1 hypothetical protein CLV37_101483 [Kineococcus rhizosphaerae]